MKRQFDFIANPDAKRRPTVPFMVVLQSHYMPMQTTIVAPVRTVPHAEGIDAIEVPVCVQNTRHAIMVSELAHIPTHLMGRTVESRASHEDHIRRALDRLFSGF